MKINRSNLKNISKKTLFDYQKLFPVLQKEKARQYGILALTFFTMTVFGVFAVNPTITTIIELQRTLEDVRLVESKLSQKRNTLQVLKGKYDILLPDLALVDRAIPQRPQPVRFIGQIQAIANNSNVTLSDMRIETLSLTGTEAHKRIKGKSNSPLPMLPENTQLFAFDITVSGTYPQVRNFLVNISNFERVTTIESISLARLTTDSPIVTLTIQGRTFYN